MGNENSYILRENASISTKACNLDLGFIDENIFRLKIYNDRFSDETEYVLDREHQYISLKMDINERRIEIKSKKYSVQVIKNPISICITDESGNIVVTTPLTRTYEVGDDLRLRLNYDSNEKIYGLGQDPMAQLDHRDRERRIWQEWGGIRRSGNAGVPFYISSNGYGLLLNSSWPSRFVIGEGIVAERPNGDDSRAPAPWPWTSSGETDKTEISIILDDGAMDLYFILDPCKDNILNGLSELTGYMHMLPRWAYGYIQSKFRYKSFKELKQIGKMYRDKQIPCDALIVDFGWFEHIGDLKWNNEFAEAKTNIEELNNMGYHVMTAQHPFISEKSINYNEFHSKGFLNQAPQGTFPTYDFSNPDAREIWWKKCSEGIFNDGIEGFWNDMGELEVHPPNTMSFIGTREKVHNIYSTLWSKAFYDGYRRESNQRVINLMRTTYPGIQRYSGVLWSGDISSFWAVLKDQIVVGQGVALSGQNYWCTDIGGLFQTDELDAELMIRWYQFGAFCPLFRTHGRRPNTEVWAYGELAEQFIKKYIELRYELLPYIYSCARQITESGKPLMRAMCIDFADDELACLQEHQYMFGPSILVAPVYEKDARERTLYLPEGEWYDFWTDKKYSGKQFISVDAPLEKIPLFVKSGSIIPMMKVMQHTSEKPVESVWIHTYKGQGNRYELYEDDGKSYNYEKNDYVKTVFISNDEGDTNISQVIGDIDLIPDTRTYNYQIHKDKINGSDIDIKVDYNLSTSGVFKLFVTIMNNLKEPIEYDVRLSDVYGWQQVDAPNQKQIVDHKNQLVWKLLPNNDKLPIIHRANLIIRNADGKEMTKEIVWGNKFATRWQIAANFSNENTLNGVQEPEIYTEKQCYESEDDRICWLRNDQDAYNCMGYVPFPVPVIESLTINEMFANDHSYEFYGYAKCKVWSPQEQTCYMDVSGESSLQIAINNIVVYKSEGIVLQGVIPKPIRLKKGANLILIRVCLSELRPFSGREYGFNFRLVNQAGGIIEDLLYEP